jgi:hypothetical protein
MHSTYASRSKILCTPCIWLRPIGTDGGQASNTATGEDLLHRRVGSGTDRGLNSPISRTTTPIFSQTALQPAKLIRDLSLAYLLAFRILFAQVVLVTHTEEA